MALYIKDNLVIGHCRSDYGLRLIMNWIVSKGDMPSLERLDHCILITTQCYDGDGLTKMSNATSNTVTIPLTDRDSDSICVNPFIVRSKRKKITYPWTGNTYNGILYHGLDKSDDKRDNGYDMYDIYKNMFRDDEYEIFDNNLTTELRDFILTIPTLIRDKKISEVLRNGERD